MCIPKRNVVQYPNNKPWYNKNIRGKITHKDKTYRNRVSDPLTYRNAKHDLKVAISQHKRDYRDKIEGIFGSGDSKKLWSHIDLITQYKPKSRSAGSDDVTLPDKLNEFYSRFDLDNTTTPAPLPIDVNTPPPFVIDEDDVRSTFSQLSEGKAPGPDSIKPKLLKRCSSELAPVFSDIFNRSLESCSVPNCYKQSTIIPVPKKQHLQF